MSKIMIIGGSGYLGSNLKLFTRELQEHEAYSTYFERGRSSCFDIKLDITDEHAVSYALRRIKPEVIIHAAAITDSNYCATHKKVTWNVNVLGTQNIVKGVSDLGARLIYISTDQVYSGNEPFYTEDDVPSPICFYGKTKLEAEKVIESSCKNYCIARTSFIFGLTRTRTRTSFDNLLDNLLADKPTRLFIDEYRSPIFLDNYLDILMELVNRSEIQGLYNISGHERVSRYGLAEYIASALSKKKSLLIPVSVDDFKFVDSRPKDCSMSNRKITETLSTTFMNIQNASTILKRQITETHGGNIA